MSEQVAADLLALRAEESHPGFNADDSDAKVAALRTRISDMRDLRTRTEDVMTKVA